MSPEEIRKEADDLILMGVGGEAPNLLRAYADLLENGEQRWWCDQHKQDGDEVGCLGAHMVGTPCRMGRVLVVPLEDDA